MRAQAHRSNTFIVKATGPYVHGKRQTDRQTDREREPTVIRETRLVKAHTCKRRERERGRNSAETVEWKPNVKQHSIITLRSSPVFI